MKNDCTIHSLLKRCDELLNERDTLPKEMVDFLLEWKAFHTKSNGKITTNQVVEWVIRLQPVFYHLFDHLTKD